MKEFICYEKLSKKKKREIDRARRRGWGQINPVTRRPEKTGIYKRAEQKAQARRRSQDYGGFVVLESA